MSKEFDLAGLASVGGWLRLRRKQADIPPGTPCGNCETELQGPFCHACGQLAEDMHKSIIRLAVESIESFFHFDGRLWRTLPNLVFRPGRLTRDYLDGRRAPQIPPFRMFLVVLILVFFVGHWARPDAEGLVNGEPVVATTASGQASEALQRELAAEKDLDPAMREQIVGGVRTAESLTAGGNPAPAMLEVDGADAATEWMTERLRAIQDDPERFLLILEIWAHRVAVLALPVSAILLTMLFLFQRRFYVFDHLVFSMHSLTFQILLLTVILSLTRVIGNQAWWLAVVAPVHLWAHMRGVYATSVVGTAVRMFLLAWGTAIGFGGLALLWLWLGVQAMGSH
jgi:hypothetical protein